MFDGRCMPLRSVGANVPNLAYGNRAGENLEWMRQHHIRWVRVFATGCALGPDRAPKDAASALAALHSLLASVESFNAVHDPNEAIYVLVCLTDYYPPASPVTATPSTTLPFVTARSCRRHGSSRRAAL